MFWNTLSVFAILFSTLTVSGVQSESLLQDFVTFNHSETSAVSGKCANDCQILSEALEIREIWALKADDASGRKPVGFFHGNNFFLGNEFICEKLDDPPEIYLAPVANGNRLLNVSTLAVKSEIPVQYRLIYLSHKSDLQFNAEVYVLNTIHIGLCLPKACSGSDLEILSNLLIVKSFNDQSDVYGEVKFKKSKRLVLRSDFMTETAVILSMWAIFSFSHLLKIHTVHFQQQSSI